MRRIALFLAPISLLAACSFAQRQAYRLTFDVQNVPIQQELMEASLRMIDEYARQLKTTLGDRDVETGTGSAVITVSLGDGTQLPAMTAMLTKPFSLRFMTRVTGKGDVTVEGQGTFADTGFGGRDVFWAEAGEDQTTGKAAVRLLFTTEGRENFRKLIKNNRGKTIGLFVQDRLVSMLVADHLEEDVVIRGIPTVAVASAFADQVNVGLHVTFTPVP